MCNKMKQIKYYLTCVLLIFNLVIIANSELENLSKSTFLSENGYEHLCNSCECPNSSFEGSDAHIVDCANKDIQFIDNPVKFPQYIYEVTFKGNKIKDFSNEMLEEGSKVIILDLSFNSIDIITSSAFSNLKNLRKLILSHNQIWSIGTSAFDGLNKLMTIDLSYNMIQDWESSVFLPCTLLKEFNLKYNPIINGLREDSFEHLTQLETLNLENTGLSNLPNGIFKYNQRLKYLYLAGNSFKTVPNQAIQMAKSLFLLDLSATQLNDIKYDDFKELSQLGILRLESIPTLEKIHANAFQDLYNLLSFYCNNNYNLKAIDPRAFTNNLTGEIISLQTINMRSNSIRNIKYEMLKWTSLEHIELMNNPWKCDCELKWMIENDAKTIKSQVKCAYPSRLSGKFIDSLTVDDLICTNLLQGDSLLVSLLLFIIITTLGFTGLLYFLISHHYYFGCKYLFRKKSPNYIRVVASKEKVELEWDHSAEP